MKLSYENTLKDMIVFARYHVLHSPTLRRSRRLGLALTFAFLLGITVTPAIIWRFPALAVVGIFGCLYSAIVYPWILRHRIDNQARRLYREGANKAIFGRHQIELSATSIVAKGDFSEGTIRLEAVEKLVSTEQHTFIYVSATSAFVIPRSTVSEGDYDAFVDALRERLASRENSRHNLQ